jgi:peptidoglycan/LPS O-acetylase OafA/YrhL
MKRNTNLDYLRLIAIFMIMVHHTYLWMQLHYLHSTAGLATQLITMVIGAGGKAGVNAFMLISGFFLVNKSFKMSRIIGFVVRTYVVTLFIVILGVVFANQSIKSALVLLVAPIFPLNGLGWWYITAYAVVLLAFPAINQLFAVFNKKQMAIGISCAVLLMSILPLFNLSTELPGDTHGALWLAVLYAIGGFMGKYRESINMSLSKMWSLLGVTIVIMAARFALILWHPGASLKLLNILGWEKAIPWRDADPFLLVISVLMFMIALKAKPIPMGGLIKILSGETLALYMLHNSNAFATKYRLMAHGLINWSNWSGLQYVAFEIGMGILLFVICSVVALVLAPIERAAVKHVTRLLDRKSTSA